MTCSLSAKEMQQINAKIAHSLLSGELDSDGFMQGLMLQMIQRLDKVSRGIQHLKGRRAATELPTERALIEEAALTLALTGGHKFLHQELGQRVKPIKIKVCDLPSMSLPNPALALMTKYAEQLTENVELLDQLFHRTERVKKRRLLMAVDCTYLERSVQQMELHNQVGLVGGGWNVDNETAAFASLEVDELPKKAPQMMEFLCWDPCYPGVRETYSLASMPVHLQAPQESQGMTESHAGNFEP